MRLPLFGSLPLAASSGQVSGSRARKRLRMVLFSLLALDGVLLLLVFRPPGRSWVEQERRLQNIRGQHEARVNAVHSMRDLRGKLQTSAQTEMAFSRENFLPRRTAFSGMLANLEALATQDSLRPSDASYRLEELGGAPGWVSVGVNLTVEGNYTDLVRFINHLEKSELFWIIEGMNVSAGQSRGLRLGLQMRTYFIAG